MTRQTEIETPINQVCSSLKQDPINGLLNDTVGYIKVVVDHYNKVLFCDVPHTASSGWIALMREIIKKQGEDRIQWAKEHPLTWNDYFPDDSFRSVKLSVKLSKEAVTW